MEARLAARLDGKERDNWLWLARQWDKMALHDVQPGARPRAMVHRGLGRAMLAHQWRGADKLVPPEWLGQGGEAAPPTA